MSVTETTQITPHSPQILIIEDDTTCSDLMEATLAKNGFYCHCFTGGNDALAWLADNVPAMIILDYSLPDMNGALLIERMHNLGMVIPFIMVTGSDDANLAVQMMKVGACDYLLKDATFYERLPAVVARTIHEAETMERLRRAEQSLRLSEARLARAQKIAHMGSWEWNVQTGEIYWSNELYRIYGLNPSDNRQINMKLVLGMVNPEDIADLKKVLLDASKYGKPFNIVYRITTSPESEIVVNCHGDVEWDEKGRTRLVTGTTLDITERTKAESEIRQLTNYDTLTGLPNRSLLHDRLKLAIAQASREHQLVGVLFLDLDRFKSINDTLGHRAGDLLLKTIAMRLSSCIRESDTLARLGSDEFVALLIGVNTAEAISTVANKILALVSEPIYIDGQETFTSGSIGIAVYPMDGDDSYTLLKHADLAMYQAKELERNNFQFFSSEMNIKMVERMLLESSMRKALEREEFFLVYQPQVDARSGHITGMEALLRWQHPELGLLTPDKFIYLAEENGFIIPIGEWVLQTACRQNRAWQKQGLPSVRVAVNLSAKQFGQYHLDEMVSATLMETGLEPKWLELEITESAIMKNAEQTAIILRKLKDMGISLAIDDFGTGYSSLAYLKLFPISRLKIDRSFVQDITTNQDDAAIAETIISMAQALKLNVIAEGVETRAQMELLSFNNCIEMQGYLFSRPVPAEQFAELLHNGLEY
ncbi:MAG: EAL domain-containing protein [Geobacteraceae bacterium]|nr:EAL domain-containing protein [Geobacteraceae bacterium]